MTTLPELSRRVSEADGPSRELDGPIFEAVEGVLCDRHVGPFLIGPNAIWGDAHGPRPVPRYTASLDAVAALIAEKLPGCEVSSCSLLFDGDEFVAAHAEIYSRSYIEGGCVDWRGQTEAKAKTEPLARLAAALLAIHEVEKTDE